MKKTAFITLVVLSISCLARAQGITVTSPNGGETLVLGKPWQIAWTAVNVTEKVKIVLITPGGAIIGVIETNLASTSSPYPWTIGQTKNGMAGAGDYKIRVITLGGNQHDVSNTQFTIAAAAAPVVIHKELPPMLPPVFLKFPRLAVSDIDLAPNVDGFGIVFRYKNVGKGALPKASEVPVKPNYRVLIDGKETARGSLFIPALPAQPGWEQVGYFGGQIILPNTEYAFNNRWHIGNMITVHINENRVMGMESHSLTLRLKPIALKYRFDLVRNGITLDWNTRILTVSLRLDGIVPTGRELLVYSGSAPSFDNYFMVRKPATPGTHVVSKKLNFITIADSQVSIYLNTFVTIPIDEKHVWDMDFRNNSTIYLKFTRPNPNPVQ